ncbi:MAG: LacI family DNA-binding transcriptional regulator [Anaerolineae bacterium]
MKRVSSIDVAKLAGVSQSSVSRVFSPNANVSDDKRERILEAARQLGYKPNVLARSLITQSTNLIGIVVADVASLFYANFLSRFSSQLREIGKQVILFNVGLEQTADDVLPTLLEYRVDALIIAATTLSADMAAECALNGTPVILFNRAEELAQVSSICIDNEDGGRQIAELLLANNHKHFAYIAGISSTQTNRLREKGYFERLQAAGITKDSILREQGDYSYKSGFDAATRLLKADNKPDAIFCAADTMAFGAIDAARALGLDVPLDVSIVGFDNVPQAGWNGYQLTTMGQPLEDLLASTLNVLTQRLDEATASQSKIELFKGELQIRQSVRLAHS